MAELATGLLGAAATVGAASLTSVSGFARRHEGSLREEIQDRRRNTEDFMENLQSGDVTRIEEQEFLTTRERAVQAETEYYESIQNYKTASWLNPIKKTEQKAEVREKKRLTMHYNHSLRSLNESMHSGSDTSSIMAFSGSPPGSNIAAEDILDWADVVAGKSDDPDRDTEEIQPPDARPGSKSTASSGIFDSRSPTPDDPKIYDRFVQTFRCYSFEFGFFLDWQRFRVLLPARHSLSPGSMRSSSALLNAIYMWGAHLLSDNQRELHFKHKALQFVATELTPVSFLYTIQAEVLLSYYFFHTGHFLEARAHTATAVALALGGGLHQIRSLNHPDIPVIEITEENEQGVHLPVPRDSIEEGERINGFWAVFMLQKNLSVALEPAARVNGIFETSGMQIDTPWPLEMNEYKQGLLTSDIHGDSTVCDYLHRSGVSSYHDRSSIAMNVKACILLHRAVLLHGQWRPNFPEREAQSWGTAFNVVDQLIKSLRFQLPSLAQLEGRGSTRTLLLTHSLLNAATIKLHSIFYSDPTSRQTCLDAARDMFRFGGTDPRGLGYLNPMMGTLWMTACSVFIDELRRIRATDPPSGSWEDTAVREKEMLGGLSDGLDALSSFARESLLMRHQLTKAQEAVGAMQ
ncbi:hypothetical protein C8F04DRAFT_1079230 [Mycena alexandri]|uniref:Xylanolytic transcriptional activator regulatory domain-containing protein n=1 Tax=Mycena alexandri TaxID=1745969 RepID=A0AAD6XAR0_9AGAR|nr:hypothetical protein C8F04DRAFT_1079230 [Mycena alexandri]